VQLWLQQEGYEPAAGFKTPSAAAAGGGGSNRLPDRQGLGKAGRGFKQQQQQQVAVLRGMRLLLKGVAVWGLNLPAFEVDNTAGEAVQLAGEAVQPVSGAVQSDTSNTAGEGRQATTEAAAAAAEGVQQTEQAHVLGPEAASGSSNTAVQLPSVLHTVLPVHLAPESTYGAAWQLPATCYSLLQPASAAAAAAARGKASSTNAAAAAAAGGWGHGMWAGGGSIALLGSGTVPQKKRARVLRDGELTLIPYGQSEAELWGRRVHSFLGAVRCGMNMNMDTHKHGCMDLNASTWTYDHGQMGTLHMNMDMHVVFLSLHVDTRASAAECT
jgi:hypothetical protein